MSFFVFYKQLNAMDCGPTCLRMIAKYYGKSYQANTLRQMVGIGKEGVSLLDISEAAEKIGFRATGVKITDTQLIREAQLPCIIHWDQSHYVVVLPNSRRLSGKSSIKIADPARGIISLKHSELLSHWRTNNHIETSPLGVALLLTPTSGFYESQGEKTGKLSYRMILQYLEQSKWQILQVFVALFATSLLQLVFPFITQSIVDTGVNTRNMQYVTIILIAQLMLVFSRTIVDFIRNRLLLYISSIINLSILSDFWMKVTSLPVSYFDTHPTGDILQRVKDNRQLQSFLTGNSLTTLFSLFNFIVYAVVLTVYNVQLFSIFLIGSILYFSWIRVFLRIRRSINYQRFTIASKENNATLQLIQGMSEIKLNGAERTKRWEWENLQSSLFKLNFKNLTYNQIQQTGALLINQGKDLFITFLVARLVIENQLTMGAMLAIQYIIGQLNSPIEQLIGFIQDAQDAKIGLERLNDIHQTQSEEDNDNIYQHMLPHQHSICLTNFSFKYPGAGNELILRNINLVIPEKKVTAIVGTSGSGKTTLLKLMLKFYQHYEGEIRIGDVRFNHLSPSFWRKRCGAVLQEGYIFNDSVALNITISEENYDYHKLVQCCKAANILGFIESLPNGFSTKLGAEGIGVSQGQKQRILIARALYKEPDFLFFDEATSALDTNNEKAITENLRDFFKCRTVVVVAHRLSTVTNADKIIVLSEGFVAEEGTHRELIALRGKYYELVRNQLELGE